MTKEQYQYVKDEADNCGVPLADALELFDILGPSEMYDGFITELENYGESLNRCYE